MRIFQNAIIKKYTAGANEQIQKAYGQYVAFFLNPATQENIRNSKEEQFQEGFLRNLFVEILGYTLNPDPNYNLITEKKNVNNAEKADGAILINEETVGVIELKDHRTTDLQTVVKQAFNYKNNHRKACYVVISNFEKLRFYIDNSVDFEEFNLFTLNFDQFCVLWFCLAYENISRDLPKQLKPESVSKEYQITKDLYKDYSEFKRELFADLTTHNPGIDQLILFKKTQKLLDRLLFILFAGYNGLLPPNSMSKIIADWERLKELDVYIPLYERIKTYFGYLNTGFNKYDVFAYNGGLFKPDEVLDSVVISDEVLRKHSLKLSKYDFASEVDVNILGHIFEHSLTEIDEITAYLTKGQALSDTGDVSKRKKDGIFYTPRYITAYIVENTLGKLCADKKTELAINEAEYFADKKRRKSATKILADKLDLYRKWLLSLTICDPACGSGAFLNAALDFLMAEHKYIDELNNKIFEGLPFQNIENTILENNLYGVDINEESVEIAKLSLWLRTAKPQRKLNSLNNNIKCGNSLISDTAIAGDKAFDWHKEFPQVFEKGGFDVVIGNPPYGILLDKSLTEYYSANFPLTKYKINLYILFIERVLQIFNKGIIHFIIPKSLLFNSYYEDIRKELINKTEIKELLTITEKVFDDAEVGGSLLIQFVIKENPDIKNSIRMIAAEKITDFINWSNLSINNIQQNYFLDIPNCEISITPYKANMILLKLQKLKPLKEFYTLKNGLNPGNIKHILISREKIDEKHKPIIWGKDITRYCISWSGQYINYDEEIGGKISIDEVKSKKGMNKQNQIDFALRNPEIFETNKLVLRKTGDSLIASFDTENYYFDTLIHGIYEKTEYYSLTSLLALLNSKPATLFYQLLHDIKGKVFAKISLDNLASFPLPNELPFELGNYANRMIFLNAELQSKRQRFLKRLFDNINAAKITETLKHFDKLNFKQFIAELKKQKITLSLKQQDEWEEYFNVYKSECTAFVKQIADTDKEIDRMVYALYGLTEEEIEIVEQ
jgi:type I restriction-modification system DNA methylase subunit